MYFSRCNILGQLLPNDYFKSLQQGTDKTHIQGKTLSSVFVCKTLPQFPVAAVDGSVLKLPLNMAGGLDGHLQSGYLYYI